ncbi:hypothetical protein [Dactylosporangium sp. NPDC000521]|uniref:hypothetical protein n=1 Tax=Dactylosporangium sp. NPDC000521 TaxID=3363975 RepID=UPI0036B872F0
MHELQVRPEQPLVVRSPHARPGDVRAANPAVTVSPVASMTSHEAAARAAGEGPTAVITPSVQRTSVPGNSGPLPGTT